jgi:hypothetical protein
MKTQLSIALGFALITSTGFAASRQECQQQITSAAQTLSGVQVAEGAEKISRSLGSKILNVIVPRSPEASTHVYRDNYVGRGCGTAEQFQTEVAAATESLSHTDPTPENRVTCDEYVASSVIDQISYFSTTATSAKKAKIDESDAFAANMRSYTDLRCGTAAEYKLRVQADTDNALISSLSRPSVSMAPTGATTSAATDRAARTRSAASIASLTNRRDPHYISPEEGADITGNTAAFPPTGGTR